jgi:hypothetical protein
VAQVVVPQGIAQQERVQEQLAKVLTVELVALVKVQDMVVVVAVEQVVRATVLQTLHPGVLVLMVVLV